MFQRFQLLTNESMIQIKLELMNGISLAIEWNYCDIAHISRCKYTFFCASVTVSALVQMRRSLPSVGAAPPLTAHDQSENVN